MDLIYCDKSFNDVGVLQGYSLDMAYGVDENDFVLKMELDTPKLKENYYIYYDGTEYGGIIDSIEVNTESQCIAYRGRTWHGMLNSYIVSPLNGQGYYILSGEAHAEIDRLLRMCGVRQTTRPDSSIFICDGVSDDGSQTDTPITIPPTYIRYSALYESLLDALSNANSRLKIEVKYNLDLNKNMVYLSAVPITNYSAYEEFESELINFKIKKQKNKTNHLICLGSGELQNRHVIHLFADGNGNIQPFLHTPDKIPVEDKNYILSKSKQKLKYDKEIARTYDCPNAQTVEHYVLTEEEPEDWNGYYINYFTKNEENYSKNERIYEDSYSLLTEKPSTFNDMTVYTRQWDSTLQEYTYTEYEGQKQNLYTPIQYKPYFWDRDKRTKGSFYHYYTEEELGSGIYVPIEPDIVYYEYNPEPYEQPKDWLENYGNYYTTDGVHYTPYPAQQSQVKRYQTVKPSDWNTRWYEYYTTVYYDPYLAEIETKYFKGEITDDEYSELKRNHTKFLSYYDTKMIDDPDYYLLYEKGAVPEWEPNTFFVYENVTLPPFFPSKYTAVLYYTREKAPSFESVRSTTGVYSMEERTVKTWQTDTYYRKLENVEKIPEWKNGIYYRKTEDHYFDLVQNGIKRLKELQKTDTLNIKLKENDNMYYIGDTILAREKITGLVLATKITKKIVTVDNGIFNIRYEVS